MNIAAVMTHLENAAKSLTAKPSVERGAGALERMSRAPGVVIYPVDGNARAYTGGQGRKAARTPGTPEGMRYKLFEGEMDYAVRIAARNDVQLTEMLEEFLRYLHAHRLHDAAENYIAVPDGLIRFSWRDPEGALLGDHTLELTIPVSAALYSDRERQLVNVRLSYAIASSLEGEDLNG